MKKIPFGATGESVSEMCLGTMMFGERCDEAESARVVDAALDMGVDFVDTAASYCGGRTEEILGRALRGRRDRVFLATKVNVPNGADYPARIAPSLEASLSRLRTDRVDLFLIHWPRPGMDPEAIVRALEGVVRAGKARHVGCCNFPAWLLARLNAVATEAGAPKLVSHQVPYNLIERGVEVEVLPQAAAERIAVTCYRPLMAGVLAGKYDPGAPMPADSRAGNDERIPKWVADHAAGVRKLFEVAKRRGVPPAHVAIAWLRSRAGVACPIVGVSSRDQFAEAVGAFDCELSAGEGKELESAFATEVREVSQNYGPLRRAFDLIAN
jgi:aryl-alcohol dehydrogenase-like predicted oxidoreductase